MNGKVTQYKVGDKVKIIDGFHSGKQAEIIKVQSNDHIRVRYDSKLFMAGLYRSDQIALIAPKQAEAQPPVPQGLSLDAARAEITKLQADVVTLTAENRQLREVIKTAIDALDNIGLMNTGEYTETSFARIQMGLITKALSEVKS